MVSVKENTSVCAVQPWCNNLNPQVLETVMDSQLCNHSSLCEYRTIVLSSCSTKCLFIVTFFENYNSSEYLSARKKPASVIHAVTIKMMCQDTQILLGGNCSTAFVRIFSKGIFRNARKIL